MAAVKVTTLLVCATNVLYTRGEANSAWETAAPKIVPDQVLIQVKACGDCGSNMHSHETDEQDCILSFALWNAKRVGVLRVSRYVSRNT
jgi:hypothetical protein